MRREQLDPHVVQLFPSHALAIAKNKILEMGTITVEACENVREYFISKSCTVKSGMEYKLVLSYSVNGKAQESVSVTAISPK